MTALSFFADEHDATSLVAWLNADPEIAFIVPDGPLYPEEAYKARLLASMGERTEATFYPPFSAMADTGYQQRWKAVHTVDSLKDGSHSLWHVPAGPLQLLTEDGKVQDIVDPWSGWTEQRAGADPLVPYFGPENPPEILLELWARHQPYSEAERASVPFLISWWTEEIDLLVVSNFQWMSDHNGASPPATWQWWKCLEAWMARNAAPLDLAISWDEDTGKEQRESFWAFPSALQKLKNGMAYYARGFELDEAIRMAQVPGS